MAYSSNYDLLVGLPRRVLLLICWILSLVFMSLFLFVGVYLILLVGSCSPFARSSILRSVLLVVMVVLGTE